MDNVKKRRIPRHVDGRIMIGRMHWKSFIFKFVPLAVIIVILVFSCFTPLTLFLGVLGIGVVFFLFSEINNKESGMDAFKDYMRYKKQGTLIYERSAVNVRTDIRCIRHKEKYENTDQGNVSITD